MKRMISICSGQYGDLSLDELCQKMSDIGYQGLELAVQAHLDVTRIIEEKEYVEQIKATLKKYNLTISAISAHLIGQCVGDNFDKRLNNFAPNDLANQPEQIRAWATEKMKEVARAAKILDVKVVTCFLGSPIWPFWYSFPQTTPARIEEGFALIKELWTPIFDVYDECGVKLALEVHPTEIAFDYYTTKKLLETLDYRKTLGLNFDPSHLQWQGMDPALFIRDFGDYIYNVHAKDVRVKLDGRSGILGSHIEFGDTRRGWNFVSLGHGNVDFDSITRELNQIGYQGPVAVEWEDSGMDRFVGAKEAFEYISKMDFQPSNISFDAALKSE
ncbi:MAG: sugar phosphate isomerase/epimerase family protein [Erysipelotrichaceae bacterium]